MSRAIDVYLMPRKRDESPMWLSFLVAKATGMGFSEKYRAVVAGGCGMDMGFHIVMNLSYALHGHESKGDGALPENQGRPFKPRKGHFRAGYSLEQRWL